MSIEKNTDRIRNVTTTTTSRKMIQEDTKRKFISIYNSDDSNNIRIGSVYDLANQGYNIIPPKIQMKIMIPEHNPRNSYYLQAETASITAVDRDWETLFSFVF